METLFLFLLSSCVDVLKQVSEKLYWRGEEQNNFFFCLKWAPDMNLSSFALGTAPVALTECLYSTASGHGNDVFCLWDPICSYYSQLYESLQGWLPYLLQIPPLFSSVSAVQDIRYQTSSCRKSCPIIDNNGMKSQILWGLIFMASRFVSSKDICLTMIK